MGRLNRYSILLLIGLLLLSGGVLAQDDVVAADAAAADAGTSEIVHTVRQGDTLYRIGLRYSVSVQDLMAHNNLTNDWLISVGQQISIPGTVDPSSTDADEVANPLIATPPIQHTVAYGETLASIASQYDITLNQLMRMNGLVNPNYVAAGEVLQVWTPELSSTAGDTNPEAAAIAIETDETAAGSSDTVEAEAAAPEADAETTDTEAAAAVDEPAAAISEVTATPAPTAEAAEPAAETTATADATGSSDEIISAEPVVHVVRVGEVLSSIASQYGVGWAAIAAENNITNPNNIRAGQTLRIPGTVRAPIDTSNLTLITDVMDAPGPQVGTGRELVVDISQQSAYAYEDGELIHAAIVSTGLPATPTVTGSFSVTRKYQSQTMSGPGYYLPGVEWVMYFYAAYAFHTAYWHDNFGQPMSHGCVNMRNEDAKFFYDFADIGTPVYVQL
jgi:LysM repeat protein